MDGVLSWSHVLFMDSVQSCVRFFLWMVSHPVSHSFYGWCPILVMAPELQEDWIGTLTGNVNIPLPGATRINPGHGTRIARGLVRYKG